MSISKADFYSCRTFFYPPMFVSCLYCCVDLIIVWFYADIVASAVLSGNRNFEGRVHPLTRANYLASPPLVVAYALAGTVCMPNCV
jgi:hypothetical protein